MLKHMMNTSTLRAVVLTVAAAVLAVFVLVPAGAKDKTLSKSELKNLVANAATKADHERIAQYFDAEAERFGAEAKDHEDIARVYQDTARTGGANHCNGVASQLRKAAEDASALASAHRGMANEAKK